MTSRPCRRVAGVGHFGPSSELRRRETGDARIAFRKPFQNVEPELTIDVDTGHELLAPRPDSPVFQVLRPPGDTLERITAMRTKAISLIVAVVCSVGAGWFVLRPDRSADPDHVRQTRNDLPAEIRSVLDAGEPFILLSLDPMDPTLRSESDPPPAETFHRFAVLGKKSITNPSERAELLRALDEGIAAADGVPAACLFSPRHGISATLKDETVDLVICFECLTIEVYARDKRTIWTTRSPLPTFHRALERARLPITSEN